jgi:CNT family concentrative nucleoside transporter
MRAVGVFGLLVLLALAWAMSYHPRRVRLRPVVWGIGLQFVFALIILKENVWSFVGMGLLAALLVLYIVQEERERLLPGLPGSVLALASAAAIGVGAGLLIPSATGWLAVASAVVAMLGRRVGIPRPVCRVIGAAVIVFGAVWLMVNGIYGQVIFAAFTRKVASFLALADYGARFLFGNLADGRYFFVEDGAAWPGFGFQFAFKVLPTIIFFGGFMGVLYYLGIMQVVIEALAKFMRWTVGTSGAETLSCSANIFVGQTEAPLLIKPFLDEMTRSELLTVMVGGFATIAGGVLAGYIALGVPAGHLIAASVMAAPAALVIGKIIFPETEHSATAGDVSLPDIETGGNVIEAATNGIGDGFKLALNVGAMLIGFIALIAVVDTLLGWADGLIDGRLLDGEYIAYSAQTLWSPAAGEYSGFVPGSLQTLFGALFRPIAFCMGVPWSDAGLVGNLLGVKVSLNEFVAYSALSQYIKDGVLSDRATVIATYALCGFANFSSIGIQIGGISALAPRRKSALAALGLKAMFGGAIASMLTATIAGMLL